MNEAGVSINQSSVSKEVSFYLYFLPVSGVVSY